jgi:xanthine/uracil permease
VTGGVPARPSAAQAATQPIKATPHRNAAPAATTSARPFVRPVPQAQSARRADSTQASATEVSLTRSLLVFFAGQFTIAGAWFASSFPAFATGVVLTLAGTGWLLRAVQRSGGQGGEEPSPVTAPDRPPARRQSRILHQRGT